jgi:hypothetical protein
MSRRRDKSPAPAQRRSARLQSMGGADAGGAAGAARPDPGARSFAMLVLGLVALILGAAGVCAALVMLTDAVMAVCGHPYVVLLVLGAALIALQELTERFAPSLPGRLWKLGAPLAAMLTDIAGPAVPADM